MTPEDSYKKDPLGHAMYLQMMNAMSNMRHNDDTSGDDDDDDDDQEPDKRPNPKENIFETRVGQFSDIKNRLVLDSVPTDPKKIWPRDYLMHRMRYAEACWELAEKNENLKFARQILKDLLFTIRLDNDDFYMASPMAGFMFLYVGRTKDAYDMIKYWLHHVDDRDYHKREICPKGSFLRCKDSNYLEDCVKDFRIHGRNPKYLLVLLAIKLKAIQDLKNMSGYFAFEEIWGRKSMWKGGKRLAEDVLEIIKGYIIDSDDVNEFNYGMILTSQKNQVYHLVQEIGRQNQTLLSAILYPKPLLAQELPNNIVIGCVTHAREMILYTWKFFEMLPETKEVIGKILYPKGFPKDGVIKYSTKGQTPQYFEMTETGAVERHYMIMNGIHEGIPMTTNADAKRLGGGACQGHAHEC